MTNCSTDGSHGSPVLSHFSTRPASTDGSDRRICKFFWMHNKPELLLHKSYERLAHISVFASLHAAGLLLEKSLTSFDAS